MNGRGALSVLGALVMVALTASAIRSSPSGQDSLPSSIRTSYDAGQYSQAAAALQAEIGSNPNDATLYFWLGRSQFELRDFSHAVSSFERAVALSPNSSDYHDWLGRACGRKADENSHSNMASALSMAKRTHSEFETAVRLDAMNVKAQRDLIEFMASAPANLGGGEERAQTQIRALSAVDPLEGSMALADLLAVKKKFDEASEEYLKILNSAPDRVDAYFEAADYFSDRGDSVDMDLAVDGGAKIASSDRRLSYYRGVALVMDKKDSSDAESDLRTYIATVPDNSELPSHSSAYEWLGRLYENQNKTDEAAEQYKTALALDPHNDAARQALKRLQKK